MRVRVVRGAAASAALAVSLGLASAARGLEVVLHDVAADRVERQRAYAQGRVPLPSTPDLGRLEERLAERGLAKGRPIYLRVFKQESELELWMQGSDGAFTLFAVYPICHWTGTLGPKLKEGDKQSPEGFYSVGLRQTRLVGRWRRAFNLGFPNLHDQLLSRSGSYILIHGGCSSVGCFAMTDQVQEEIYGLAHAALTAGQGRFQVHVFPFRMTAENMAAHADHEWAHTWADLQPAYDSFERTRVPPRIVLCGVRYKVADGLPGETGGTEARLPVLRPAAPSSNTVEVADSSGVWSPPPCVLDDEERRRAAYTLAGATAGEIPAEERRAIPHGTPPAQQPQPTGPPPQQPQARHEKAAARVVPRKSTSRGAAAAAQSTKPAAAPDGQSEGFGTALPANRGRLSATGG